MRWRQSNFWSSLTLVIGFICIMWHYECISWIKTLIYRNWSAWMSILATKEQCSCHYYKFSTKMIWQAEWCRNGKSKKRFAFRYTMKFLSILCWFQTGKFSVMQLLLNILERWIFGSSLDNTGWLYFEILFISFWKRNCKNVKVKCNPCLCPSEYFDMVNFWVISRLWWLIIFWNIV